MSHLPSGTVTFLFTDIEASTRLAQQHPQAWEAARQRHHALLRAAVEAHGGHVFQVVGDAVCAAFATAAGALQAALAGQQALHAEPWGDTPVRVRMGLHTGPAEPHEGGDYRGYLTLVRVQRVMAAGHGGQVLLSHTAQELVRDQLPPDVTLRDLGQHAFKGLEHRLQLFQAEAPGLPHDFPPLMSLGGGRAVPNNLPAPLTSFVGRRQEVATVQALLGQARLVTLTGVGGTGKTRLAIRVAIEVLDGYPDGVWFVDLSPLVDPGLIASTAAGVLGLRESGVTSILEVLTDHLRDRQTLIVLDNCEHLLEGAAHWVEHLLRHGPRLRLLATSRESLGVAGEQSYRVPSLALPPGASGPGSGPTPSAPPGTTVPAELLGCESVELFVERARLARPSFALTAQNAASVAQICRRLDGIPLALELAAARVKALSVEQIAARLSDRSRLLTGTQRTAVRRQQTLHASLDWSHELLPVAERTLLRRLAVFAGGWTLEAAEAVGAREGIAPGDVIDLLTRLVDHSLVLAEEHPGAARYRMLETIREYALEKLGEAGESQAVRDRHLGFYVDFAEQAERALMGPEQVAWLEHLEEELDNLRGAIEWSLSQADVTPGLRLAGALWWFWYTYTDHREGMAALRALLAQPSAQARTPVRAKGLSTFVYLAAAERETDWTYDDLVTEALEIARAGDDAQLLLHALGMAAVSALVRGDLATRLALLDEQTTVAEASGHDWYAAFGFGARGRTKLRLGDLPAAVNDLSRSAEILRGLGDKNLLASVLRTLGRVRLRQGQVAEAESLMASSVRLNGEIGDRRGLLTSLTALAAAWTVRGQTSRALHILGAVDALLGAIHARPTLGDRPFYGDDVATLRARVDPAIFEVAWAEGRTLTMEQAIALGLGGEPPGESGLTPSAGHDKPLGT
jgi:predicted ATPase/class 3 adenylate cyclase